MLTAFKRIPELFPFPMAKRAYCKQYAVVLLPIFAYVKSYEEERTEKEVLFPLHCCLLRPPLCSAPLVPVKEKPQHVQDSAGGQLHLSV